MKVGAVSFPLTKPHDFSAWLTEAENWIKKAGAENVNLLVFPEYMSLALETHTKFLNWYNEELIPFFSAQAKSKQMAILAGTHNLGHNVAPFFLPNGKLVEQKKIHLIPTEPEAKKGHELIVHNWLDVSLFTAICYDVEFPELTRAAVREGIQLLLCPSWTEKWDGFNRVRTCALARAIENQIFVVHAPLVGSLSPWGVDEVAVGRAAILTPCDPSFPANGILAEGPENVGALVTAHLDFGLLQSVREAGAVRTYRDFMSPSPFQVKKV